MITGIQVVSALLGLAMTYTAYSDFRRSRYGRGAFVFWLIVWVGLIFVSLVPRLFQPLTHPFAARLMDIIIVLGMLMFGVLVYRMYVDVQKLRRQLEDVVREDALRPFEGSR